MNTPERIIPHRIRTTPISYFVISNEEIIAEFDWYLVALTKLGVYPCDAYITKSPTEEQLRGWNSRQF